MKHTRILCLLLVAALICSFAPADWVNYESKEGNFKIGFPREPKQDEQTIESPIGQLVMHMVSYEVEKYKDDNAAYLAMYSDYPDSLVNSDFKDEILDKFFKSSVSGAASNVEGKIVSQKKISYKGFPGMSAKVTIKNGEVIMNMQMLLVKNRTYMMEVITEKKHDNNPTIAKFFGTFALLNPKP